VFKRILLGFIAIAAVTGSNTVTAQTPAPAAAQPAAAQEAPKPNDYNDPKNWLCRPGRTDDACAYDMTTTVVSADGKLTPEPWSADPKAPIDCFYVYPTVSMDQTPNSDMSQDPAEINVVRQQFARFASKCRPFAPMYRQVTISALTRALATGGRPELDRGLGYDDVRDAWNAYLKSDNQGRGVVLVGHSQGSYILTALIRNEIEGKPVQSRIVSAILMGATVPVAKGKDVGGAFKTMPLCKAASQTGCVIAFTSFRSTIKPPANTLFGKVDDPALEAGCTNPASLAGGSGQLHAYLASSGRTITGTTPPQPWVTPAQEIKTPWVSVPGLLTASCASNEHAKYLEVTVHGDPKDPRVDDIVGDLGRVGAPAANWGLHLVDANLAMGNLLDIVGQQTKAYLAKAKK
jgi:hypothetical protein